MVVGEKVGSSDFDQAVKETRIFQGIQQEIIKAFEKWYGVETLPCLLEEIVFLSDGEFEELYKKEKPQKTLFIRALTLAGVKEEELLDSQNDPQGKSGFSPFGERKIYLRESTFLQLLSPKPEDYLPRVLSLGVDLIHHNLSLLPQERKAEGEEKEVFIDLIKERFPFFLEKFKEDSKVSPLEFEKAKEALMYLLTEDPTRQILFCGAKISLTLAEGEKDRSQLVLLEEINQGIIFELASWVERSFIHFLSQKFSFDANAYREYRKGIIPAEEKGLRALAEEFFNMLKLKSYSDQFSAFRESEIPLRFLERLKVKPELREFL